MVKTSLDVMRSKYEAQQKNIQQQTQTKQTKDEIKVPAYNKDNFNPQVQKQSQQPASAPLPTQGYAHLNQATQQQQSQSLLNGYSNKANTAPQGYRPTFTAQQPNTTPTEQSSNTKRKFWQRQPKVKQLNTSNDPRHINNLYTEVQLDSTQNGNLGYYDNLNAEPEKAKGWFHPIKGIKNYNLRRKQKFEQTKQIDEQTLSAQDFTMKYANREIATKVVVIAVIVIIIVSVGFKYLLRLL